VPHVVKRVQTRSKQQACCGPAYQLRKWRFAFPDVAGASQLHFDQGTGALLMASFGDLHAFTTPCVLLHASRFALTAPPLAAAVLVLGCAVPAEALAGSRSCKNQTPVLLARNFPAPSRITPSQRIQTRPLSAGPRAGQDAQNLQHAAPYDALVGGVLGGRASVLRRFAPGNVRNLGDASWALLGSQVGCNAGQGPDPCPVRGRRGRQDSRNVAFQTHSLVPHCVHRWTTTTVPYRLTIART